ncbi:MAG TPA: SGNH/GDSL hydrolase family protein [Acidisarcina sp.]
MRRSHVVVKVVREIKVTIVPEFMNSTQPSTFFAVKGKALPVAQPRRFVLLAGAFLVGIAVSANAQQVTITPDDSRVAKVGRYDDRTPAQPRFGYPGAGVIVRFTGTALTLNVKSDSAQSALNVVVDHGASQLRLLSKGDNAVSIATGLASGLHIAEIIKRTETWQGVLILSSLTIDGGTLLDPPVLPRRKLMFIGDSVTCGAGVDNNATCMPDPALPASNGYEAFGMVLGRRLDAQVQLVCYGGRGLERDYRGLGIADGVPNAPEFFQLSIPADDPASRAPWEAARFVPDGILISLGTNDFNLQQKKPLNGTEWVARYVAFVKMLRGLYPGAKMWLTEGTIVTDPLLRQYVQAAVAAVGDPNVRFVHSEHYPGNGCNGHPTRAQHLAVADGLEPVLREGLGW